MEVDEVEQRLEQRPAARLALDLRQRIEAVGEQGPLFFESPPGQLRPGARPRVEPERQAVEEQSQHPFAVDLLGPGVEHQARGHLALAAHQTQHPQVRRQQHALDRNPQTPGHLVQTVRHLRRHLEPQPLGPPLCCWPEAGPDGKRRQGSLLHARRPELTGLLRLQCFPLPRHVVAHQRLGCRRPPLSQVVPEKLGQQGGHAPAVEDGVVEAQRELEADGAPAVDLQAQQRRPRPVEWLEPFRRQPLGYCRFVQILQVLDRHRHRQRGVDQLQRLAEALQIKTRAQHGMAGHQALQGR